MSGLPERHPFAKFVVQELLEPLSGHVRKRLWATPFDLAWGSLAFCVTSLLHFAFNSDTAHTLRVAAVAFTLAVAISSIKRMRSNERIFAEVDEEKLRARKIEIEDESELAQSRRERERAELDAARAKAEADAEEHRRRGEQARLEAAKAARASGEIETGLAAARQELEQLRTDLVEAKEQKADLSQQVATLNTSLSELRSLAQRSSEERERLRVLSEQNSEAQTQIESERRRISRELDELAQQRAGLRGEQDRFRAEKEQLARDTEDLHQQKLTAEGLEATARRFEADEAKKTRESARAYEDANETAQRRRALEAKALDEEIAASVNGDENPLNFSGQDDDENPQGTTMRRRLDLVPVYLSSLDLVLASRIAPSRGRCCCMSLADTSARLFLCALCRAVVAICRACDRGNRYCGPACRRTARRESVDAATRRYRRSQGGREKNAERQRRYRERQRERVEAGQAAAAHRDVTHQRDGSPPEVSSELQSRLPVAGHVRAKQSSALSPARSPLPSRHYGLRSGRRSLASPSGTSGPRCSSCRSSCSPFMHRRSLRSLRLRRSGAFRERRRARRGFSSSS